MLSLWDRVVLQTFSAVERFERRSRKRGPKNDSEPNGLLGAGKVAAGRYKLEAVLGEGGMGRVWLADDQLDKRRVALKEMRSAGGAASPELDVAFKREFYTMTKLQHPGTVKVYDAG